MSLRLNQFPGTMAKNIEFLVCFLIMVMDIIAGVLGIQAEVAENKVCDYLITG